MNEEDKNFKIFREFSSLLELLVEHFNNNKPLKLYKRLVEKTTILNKEAINKHTNIIKKFILTYKDEIVQGNVPVGAQIVYRKDDKLNIFIDIGKFYNRLNGTNRKDIYDYLLVLCGIIEPDDKIIDLLGSTVYNNKDNPEQDFINELMTEAKSAVKEITKEKKENVDIKSLLKTIVEGGLIENTLNSLETKANSGQIDPQKMMTSMTSLLGGMLSQNAMQQFTVPEPTIEEINGDDE